MGVSTRGDKSICLPVADEADTSKCLNPLGHALFSLNLARKLNFGITHNGNCQSQKLVSQAPLLSELFGKRVALLSGWSDFNNSVKAFQVLGLVVEQVRSILEEIEALQELEKKGNIAAGQALEKRRFSFLATRKDKSGLLIFHPDELTSETLNAVEPLHLVLWEAFAHKPIVCTTSSNFGIAMHDVLVRMQSLPIILGDKIFHILNYDEGDLTIWCPRRGSDIMRDDKDDILQAKIDSTSLKCELRRYDTREERDINAICQLLENSGYFFPTTPQSKADMEAILAAVSLVNPGLPEKTSQAVLKSLKSSIRGGIYGAMIPYLCPDFSRYLFN